MDKVVLENKHKFVYYDNKSIKDLRMISKNYPPKINSEEPIAIYIKTTGLPSRVSVNKFISRDIIKVFHENYFQLLIFSEMINVLSKNIDNVELNNRLKRVFRLCSCVFREKIDDIKKLKKIINDSKKNLVNAYYEYLRHSKINFYDDVSMSFMLINYLIPILKDAIGLKKHFGIILELNENISLYNCVALNDYISYRNSKDVSINVLLSGDTKLEFYCTSNGEIVESIYDYVEKDFREGKTKLLKK